MATQQQMQTALDALTAAQVALTARLAAGIIPDAQVAQVAAVTAALNTADAAPPAA